MKLDFEEKAFEDFQYWIKNEKRKALRILQLLEDIEKQPYEGIGKPEALKFNQIYQVIGQGNRIKKNTPKKQ